MNATDGQCDTSGLIKESDVKRAQRLGEHKTTTSVLTVYYSTPIIPHCADLNIPEFLCHQQQEFHPL